MNTYAYQSGFRKGASLVEVAITMLIFMIVVLGSSYYRYFTAVNVQTARNRLTGADVAVTLLETWEGRGGLASYGPDNELSSYLTISPTTEASAPSGYTLLGAYDVTVDGRIYSCTLYWKDVESDLRELGVTVSWPLGNGQQQRTYQLATYVEI